MSLNHASRSTQENTESKAVGTHDCRICSNIVNKENREEGQPWDTVLRDTGEFVCTPTIGSFLEGYVLTIPKSHSLCAGALSDNEISNYWNFTKNVSEVVEREYGESLVFEHGPAKPDTQVGCGVDHTHMHIVPVGGPIWERASHLNSAPIEWRTLSSMTELRRLHRSGTEYVFFWRRGDQPRIGTSSVIDSQLFRRAIADKLDMPEKFDWKENPFDENVIRTAQQLGPELYATQESEQG